MSENYTFSVKKKKFWTIIVPSAVLVMFAGIGAGMLIVDKVIMPRIVGVDKGIVDVPDIGRLPWEEARQKLFDVGLRMQITDRVYHEEIPKGSVISQKPEPLKKVKKGRPIGAVISNGSESGVVPELAGMTETQVRLALRKAGFPEYIITEEYDDEVPKDEVVEVLPQPGTLVSREMPLEIVISNGPEPTHAEVPSLVGERLVEAKQKIAESDLTVGTISYTERQSLPPGTVVSQSVSPGTRIPLKAAVDIVVSTAR